MKKMNRTGKYFVFACAILILMNAFLGLTLTYQMSTAMKTLIQKRMLDISNTAAAMLDGDDLARIRADDVDKPEYQQILKTLTYFQDNIELEYIYCIREKSDKEYVFSVDPTVEDPGVFGSPIVYTPALYQASRGVASVDEEPYTDDWGTFYSAYSPVFDSNGDVAGVVAVDFSAEWYESHVATAMWTTGIILALAGTISITIAMLIASSYRKKCNVLIRQMNGLSDGIETLIHEVAPDAEVLDEDEPKERLELNWDDAMEHDEIVALSDNLRFMQDHLRAQIAFVQSRAFYDGLTGFKNRTAYEEDVAKLDAKIPKGEANFSIAVFDINQLKIINDDFGHEAGDRIIVIIAKEIQKAFAQEKIYRIGGDEFAVILKGVDPALQMLQLRSRLELLSEKEQQLREHGVEIAVSMGSAIFRRETDASYAVTFHRADKAMYADKRAYYQTHEDRRKRDFEKQLKQL